MFSPLTSKPALVTERGTGMITSLNSRAAQFLVERTCPFFAGNPGDERAKAWLAEHGPIAVWVDPTIVRIVRGCGHRGYTVLRESAIAARTQIGYERVDPGRRPDICVEMGRFIE